MNYLSIYILLFSLLVIKEFHSIDGSVKQIFEKVKQEVEDLIDSQDVSQPITKPIEIINIFL